MTTTNILVVGTGGQGVMTATDILAVAAMSLGHDVKKTEVAGMSQRGGVVTSSIRFGERVLSPQITPGKADIMLAFEAAEGLRHQHYLKPGGLALVNDARIVPPVVNIGMYDYPENPVAQMQRAGVHVIAFDAMTIARELGDVRYGNTVMLGAVADHLPFPADVLLEAIVGRFRARKPHLVAVNEQAFEAGRQAVRETAAV